MAEGRGARSEVAPDLTMEPAHIPWGRLCAAGAVAALVRAAAAAAVGAPMGDTASYLECASAVLRTFACPQPETFPFFRAPGYPALLALSGGGAGTFAAQAALDGATAVLVGVLGALLLSPRIGVLAACAY